MAIEKEKEGNHTKLARKNPTGQPNLSSFCELHGEKNLIDCQIKKEAKFILSKAMSE